MDSIVDAMSTVTARSEIPSQVREPLQRQLELVQELIERERRLQEEIAEQVLAPVDVAFDLLEQSGATMRRQAAALEAAGDALRETASLMSGQAELFEQTISKVRAPAHAARATRWVVLLFAIATALTEIGIGRDMVLIAFGTLFGGIVAALALAFGLGGRHVAREILERGRRREREPAGQDPISHL